jgi:raffinose/stachyose/melibiose transport system substrate-binding protein
MNRKSIGMLIAALLLVFMAACGKSGNDSAPQQPDNSQAPASSAPPASSQPAEEVKLKFLYTWPEFETTMKKTISMFEESHPNIKVEVNVTPWDKIKDQLQVAFASGEAPDVTFMWPKDMSIYIGQGVAMDLTPYFDQEWKDSFIDPVILEAGIYDGKVYNLPFRGSTTFIAYNKDMFDANGWTEPANLEELEQLMDKMLAKGITPFAIAGNPNGFQIEKMNQYFVGYNLMKDGILTDPEYVKARKVDIKGPYAEAFKKSKEWYKKGYYGKSPLGVSREQAQALFYTGKSAMILLNNNELTAMRDGVAGKFKMQFMVIPAPEGAQDFFLPGGFDGFMVNANTKNPDASIELMKFLNSEAVQNLWAEETLSVMTRKGVTYNDPDMNTFAKYMNVAGKYTQFPDYNVGDVVTRNAQEFANFLLQDSYTPEKLEQVWNDNYKKQIELATK